MHKLLLIISVLFYLYACNPTSNETNKPRIIISTDIGGTDPDDNQSMTHLLMYNNLFNIEGLISSPSYGDGSKEEIFRMIELYEKDLPKLKKHENGFSSADYLRSITKQGNTRAAPFKGFTLATEGSDWIIKCARKESDQPLWILVWGGLDDIAQALHVAPDIQDKIRIYWIGGPNKKWSTNSYAFIVDNFPNLWFIEANATYRGFFSNKEMPDKLRIEKYYEQFIDESGHLGKDFKKYYQGRIKMGDTPSLLYLMHGDPKIPEGESWGGSFEKLNFSPRIVINHHTTLQDTVPVYSIIEFHFKGPEIDIPEDSSCFTMSIANQKWGGHYQGDGNYVIRYAPKQAETLSYSISSNIIGFQEHTAEFVVDNQWPGNKNSADYPLGNQWFTDRSDPELFDGKWQGAQTVNKWRDEALLDWAERWKWLKTEK